MGDEIRVETDGLTKFSEKVQGDVARTIETGEAWYWSRSRRELWRKGATSGQTQTVAEMRIDCDQDAVWLRVRIGGDGGCCHTGRRSCFYRTIPLRGDGFPELAPVGSLRQA